MSFLRGPLFRNPSPQIVLADIFPCTFRKLSRRRAIPSTMAALKSIILLLLFGYGALVALAYFAQRALMYFPDRTRTPPAQAGLPEAEEVTLEAADGEKLVAWYVPAAKGKPVVLYFHGNGGALVHRLNRFRRLIAHRNG